LGKYIKEKPFVCVYREGMSGRDRDNRYTVDWQEPEVKMFPLDKARATWIKEREIIAAVDPNHYESGYVFEVIYSGCKA